MTEKPLQGMWALILGASSGFGGATARALAAAGMNIAGVHLDLRSTLPAAKAVIADIEAAGGQALFFNTNAADPDRRARVLDGIEAAMASSGTEHRIHVFMHSLAFGSLLPFIADKPEEAVSQAQMEMTLNVMANSLVYWVQDMVRRDPWGRAAVSSVCPARVAVKRSPTMARSRRRRPFWSRTPGSWRWSWARAVFSPTASRRGLPTRRPCVRSRATSG